MKRIKNDELVCPGLSDIALSTPLFWAVRALGNGLGIRSWEGLQLESRVVEMALRPVPEPGVKPLIFTAKVSIDMQCLAAGGADLISRVAQDLFHSVVESVSPFLMGDIEKVAERRKSGLLSCEFRGGQYDGDVMEILEETRTGFPMDRVLRPGWSPAGSVAGVVGNDDDIPTAADIARPLVYDRGWVSPRTLRWQYTLV